MLDEVLQKTVTVKNEAEGSSLNFNGFSAKTLGKAKDQCIFADSYL